MWNEIIEMFCGSKEVIDRTPKHWGNTILDSAMEAPVGTIEEELADYIKSTLFNGDMKDIEASVGFAKYLKSRGYK